MAIGLSVALSLPAYAAADGPHGPFMVDLWPAIGIYRFLGRDFAKLGLPSADPNAATAVRAIIMTVFCLALSLSRAICNKFPQLLPISELCWYIGLSGLAGALSWLSLSLVKK